MEKVTLYTTHCPKCKAIAMKLDQKGIKYEIVDDKDIVLEFAKQHNLTSAPILVVGDYVYQVFDFSAANAWINKQ